MAFELAFELGWHPPSMSLTEELLSQTYWGDDLNRIRDLLQRGADINGTDSRGFTPLMHASFCGIQQLPASC